MPVVLRPVNAVDLSSEQLWSSSLMKSGKKDLICLGVEGRLNCIDRLKILKIYSNLKEEITD